MRKIGADAALALGYGRSAPFTQCQGSTPRGVWTSDVHGQRTDRKGDILTLDKRGHFNFGLTSSATGWSMAWGSNKLICVVRNARIANSGVFGISVF